MTARIAVLVAFVALATPLLAQDAGAITTFILVRHAEKANDGTQDPDLSDEGKSRAQRLAERLKHNDIAAIYSTNYKRTKGTVAPLAEKKGLEIQSYHPGDAQALAKMLDKHQGGTILVSGHSNTIPPMANMLLGKKALENFQDDDYGNILIVSVKKIGDGTMVRITD